MLVITYEVLHGIGPSYLKNHVSPIAVQSGQKSRDEEDMQVAGVEVPLQLCQWAAKCPNFYHVTVGELLWP